MKTVYLVYRKFNESDGESVVINVFEKKEDALDFIEWRKQSLYREHPDDLIWMVEEILVTHPYWK